MSLYPLNSVHVAALGLLGQLLKRQRSVVARKKRHELNLFNQILSLQLMGFLGPKSIYASYQFISSPVSTVLGLPKRGLLDKGDQVSVQI